jgi:hypothetical protein
MPRVTKTFIFDSNMLLLVEINNIHKNKTSDTNRTFNWSPKLIYQNNSFGSDPDTHI